MALWLGMLENQERNEYRERHWDERERAWRRRRTVTRLGLIARNKSFSANRPGQKPATMVHRSL